MTILSAAILSVASIAFGAEFSWNGGNLGSWNDKTNWSPEGVPGNGDTVDLSGVYHRLIVRFGQPQVKGGDGFTADLIFPGHIQTGLQLDVVNGEAGDFLHSTLLLNLHLYSGA